MAQIDHEDSGVATLFQVTNECLVRLVHHPDGNVSCFRVFFKEPIEIFGQPVRITLSQNDVRYRELIILTESIASLPSG